MQTEKQIINAPSVTQRNSQYILGATLIALLLFAYYFYTWRNAYNFRAAMDTLRTTVLRLRILLLSHGRGDIPG